MTIETFTIIPNVSPIISYVFIMPALTVFIAGIFQLMRSGTTRKRSIVIIVVFALVAAGIGSVGFYLGKNTNSPAYITIGNGFIQVKSSETGTVNVTSSQITYAYVSNILTGNLTISSKQHGLSNSVDKIGVFTLSNGKTAYVISDSSKDILIQMNSGKYLIVGDSNITEIVSLFSQNVYSVT